MFRKYHLTGEDSSLNNLLRSFRFNGNRNAEETPQPEQEAIEEKQDEEVGYTEEVGNSEDYGSAEEYEKSYGTMLFARAIQEKKKLRQEKVMAYRKSLKKEAFERKMNVQMELEKAFDNFFKDASNIIQQARSQEESKLAESLGLADQDVFDGKFTFAKVKKGESTMRDVSNIFRPHSEQYLRGDDDIAVCLVLISGREPPINYNPMSDLEYKQWQRYYLAVARIIKKFEEEKKTSLDVSKAWFPDVISMKLLAEFTWRNLDNITEFVADGAKGFEKKNGLMVMQALKECKTLKKLSMNHANLSTHVSAGLALVAKFSEKLENASLEHSRTSDPGACFWGLALATGCQNLRTLNLSRGNIGSSGATALAIGLSSHRALKELNLSHNFIDRDACQRIGQALLVNPTLEVLNLEGNTIKTGGAISLAVYLTLKNCTLKELNLADNDITADGGRALALGLSVNGSITKFILDMNDIGKLGAAGFGICLQKTKTLEYLSLKDCSIDSIAAASIAIGLEKNTSLKTLNLSYQMIGDGGCSQIARNMAENPNCQLEKLDLSSNMIRDEGALGLVEMLKKNTSLVDLLLGDNQIQDDAAKKLGQISDDKENKTLKKLDLSDNPISEGISVHWLAKAKGRPITSQETQLLDVVSNGTELARNNLRGYGVVAMRTLTGSSYAMITMTIAVVGQWFGFITNVVVASRTIETALTTNNASAPGATESTNLVYAALTGFFVILPFCYIIVMFSLPGDDEAPNTLSSSSLMLGTNSKNSTLKSHLKEVSTTSCGCDRLHLFLLNFFQLRISYEVHLSREQGITTLAYSSIRLAEVIFSSIPQSLIQLSLLLSQTYLQKIELYGGLYNGSDDTVLLLVVSVAASVAVLTNTSSGLFEQKFLVNWKRTKAHEESAFVFGFFLTFFYHFSHYYLRGLTIILAFTIFGPSLAVALLGTGILLRLLLRYASHSERRNLFVVVSFLIGSASWDTRRSCRIVLFLESIETLIVVIPLWMPMDRILADCANFPLAFNPTYPLLVTSIGPLPITIFLCVCYGISFLIYVCFIERIHPYRDVPDLVDPEAAQALANQAFQSLLHQIRQGRRESMGHAQGNTSNQVSAQSIGRQLSGLFHRTESFLTRGVPMPSERTVTAISEEPKSSRRCFGRHKE